MIHQAENIGDLVQTMVDEDGIGNTTISKHVKFSLRATIEKIDAYLNSKHTSGSTDSKGRDKPFFNIVTAARNIWFRATDLDTKNIHVKATKQSHYTIAFIATILLKQFMRVVDFGIFLNEWGRTLASYGSAVSKFVEKDGKLIPSVIPWNRIICDPVDFESNPVIERLWLTPAQLLRNKSYDQGMVKNLLEALITRETMDGQKKDNKSEYIPLYEVHLDAPLSYLTGMDDDDDEYVQQMHVISLVVNKDNPKSADKSDFDTYTLYSGKESKSPYQIDHLIPEDGRSLSIGAVENLFEAQWMTNHSAKQIKDQLDLASKLIFQTSDGGFVGQNALTSIETGDIMIHALNQPLTMLHNTPDIGALQSTQGQWKELGREINGIAESMTSQAKAGTAWRQTQAELQEAHSLFELMTENKGLGIKRMMKTFIIPFVKKQMDTVEEISEILEAHQVKKLDSMFVPAEAIRRVNKKIVDDILNKTPEDILNGNLMQPGQENEMLAEEQQEIQNSLNTLGNQRFIKASDIDGKAWSKVLKDLEWEAEIDITGESQDTDAILSTLTTMLQFYANKQGMPLTSEEKLITGRILEETGALSAVEIDTTRNMPEQPVQQPMQQMELNK